MKVVVWERGMFANYIKVPCTLVKSGNPVKMSLFGVSFCRLWFVAFNGQSRGSFFRLFLHMEACKSSFFFLFPEIEIPLLMYDYDAKLKHISCSLDAPKTYTSIKKPTSPHVLHSWFWAFLMRRSDEVHSLGDGLDSGGAGEVPVYSYLVNHYHQIGSDLEAPRKQVFAKRNPHWHSSLDIFLYLKCVSSLPWAFPLENRAGSFQQVWPLSDWMPVGVQWYELKHFQGMLHKLNQKPSIHC